MTASEQPDRAFVRDASRPEGAEILGSDRFGRLRAELAEAVASAELAMMRKDVEKWQAVAAERDRALDRADLAIQAFATAISTSPSAPASPAPPAERREVTRVAPEVAQASRELTNATRELAAAARALIEARDTPQARPIEVGHGEIPAPSYVPPETHEHEDFAEVVPDHDAPDDVTPIPDYVREEAARYAQTLEAMQEYKIDLARPRHWWQFWR